MKIIVPIKQIVDPAINVRVKNDGSGIEIKDANKVINPFCAIALEQSVLMKEQGIVDEILVVCIGDDSAQEQLRSALASGADRAILIKNSKILQPINIAKLLFKVVKEENPDLVLIGKQSVDYDNNQTGQMLATLLDWPQVSFASQIIINEKSVVVECEIDDGLETLMINMPAVITVDLRLCEPRFASLPNIIKAKSKSLEIINIESLGVELKEHIEIIDFSIPPSRKSGVMLESIEELINILKNKEKVI